MYRVKEVIALPWILQPFDQLMILALAGLSALSVMCTFEGLC